VKGRGMVADLIRGKYINRRKAKRGRYERKKKKDGRWKIKEKFKLKGKV
jgi:hypothetical protein